MSTILFLHGQPGSARDWDAVRLAIGDNAQTIAIDRPGWGSAGAARDLAGNAAAAVAALKGQDIDRAVVVGFSFGAAVACCLALTAPERVAALGLIAPAANVASLYRVDRLLALPAAGELGSAALMAGAGATLLAGPARRYLGASLKVEEDYLRHTGTLLRNPRAWRSFATEQRVLVRELPSLERRLDEVRRPTMIITGEQDWIVPRRAPRRLAEQLTGARLVELAGAGHLLPMQRPQKLAGLVMSLARGACAARPAGG